jgi:hypothetical protein
MSDERREQQPIRSEDPSLSPEANRQLTEELREAVGRDAVEVPAGTRLATEERRAEHGSVATALAGHRVALGLSFLVLLTVGVAISLATGSWWALVAALAVHALGTLIVAGGAVQMTTETEHVSPGLAARLEDEGVADPDRAFSGLVEDVARADEGSPKPAKDNQRTVDADQDPGTAAAEQRSATTPSSPPSKPVPGPDGWRRDDAEKG